MLQDWVTQRGLSWSWIRETTWRAACPPWVPHRAHTSAPGDLLASPAPALTQKQLQWIPKQSANKLWAHPAGDAGALGFHGHWAGFTGLGSLATAARAVRAMRGHSTCRGMKSLRNSAPCERMPHASFPGEEGPLRLFLAAGGQERGCLSQAAADSRSELAAHPPTHPQARRPALLLKGQWQDLPEPRSQGWHGRAPAGPGAAPGQCPLAAMPAAGPSTVRK